MITSFFKPKKSVVPPSINEDTEKASCSSTTKNVSTCKPNGVKRPRPKSSSKIEYKSSLETKKHGTVSADHELSDPSNQPSKRAKVVDNFLVDLTEKSWRDALTPYVASPSFTTLAKFVASERTHKTVYPPQCDTFSALNLVPLHKVKVVIVGQDPYHQPNQGHGLAFSVRRGEKIPPSLRNIYKELANDDHVTNFPPSRPTHGHLERWAQQGVLLLNAVLTVRRNEPNSHAKRGWEAFTDEIIRVLLSSRGGEDDHRGIVFLLWGRPAGNKAEAVVNRATGPFGAGKMGGGKRRNPHVVISTSHPSPLGATKTNQPFLGSRCFSRANEALVGMGLGPVDWRVDGPLEKVDGPMEEKVDDEAVDVSNV